MQASAPRLLAVLLQELGPVVDARANNGFRPTQWGVGVGRGCKTAALHHPSRSFKTTSPKLPVSGAASVGKDGHAAVDGHGCNGEAMFQAVLDRLSNGSSKASGSKSERLESLMRSWAAGPKGLHGWQVSMPNCDLNKVAFFVVCDIGTHQKCLAVCDDTILRQGAAFPSRVQSCILRLA